MKDLTIIFDLDGTLVDTAPDLIAVTDIMLEGMGCPPVPREAGRIAAGQGAKALMTAGLRAHDRPLPDEAEWPELIGRFIALYEARIAELSRPFDGVAEFLHMAREEGARLAVCTNKKDFLAEKLLSALGLAEHFAAITGGNTAGIGKPDPAPVLHCLRQAGGSPGRAVIIGDSLADILAARAAGVASALAAWGYLDRPPGQYQADFVLQSITDAPALTAALVDG